MKTSGTYPRVSLAFARKIDTDLIAFTRNVITLMTGNTHYPTPSPALTVITTAVNALETPVHDALDGGKIAIATRNAARAEMLSLLRQLAAYVTGNCNADLVLLLSSGFEPVKAPSPVGVLPAPENLRLSLTGISGELNLRFDRVPNAVNYSVQSRAEPGRALGRPGPVDLDPCDDQRSHTGQGLLGARPGERQRRRQRLGRPG